MEDKRVWLVTGAAGFIGSNIVERLLSMDQIVLGLDNLSTGHMSNLDFVNSDESYRDRFTFINVDVRDLDACRQACRGVNYVLHQAALGSVPRSIDDPVTSNEVNITGTLNMLSSAVSAGVDRFVYASSSSVYGDHEGLPKIEDNIGLPLSPYAVTKRAVELYASAFSRHYALPTIGLRYFNVFGPRQDPESQYSAVIPRWINAMSHHKRCYINGDGETSRDFCYVSNVVQANILAALSNRIKGADIFNIAFGKRTTLNELYAIIRCELAKYLPSVKMLEPTYRQARPGDVRHSQADVSKARYLLKYRPTHSLVEGLIETIGWYVRRNDVISQSDVE